jgi:GAF domain-containing protein
LKALVQSLPCSAVSAVLFEPGAEVEAHGRAPLQSHIPDAVLRAETPTFSDSLPLPLPETPLFDRLSQTLGVFSSQEVEREADLEALSGFFAARGTRALLAIPLAVAGRGTAKPYLYGMLLVHADHPYHFDADETGLARTLSNQAAIAIQNASLYAETRSLTQDLERRVQERTAQLAREHHRTETLLRILTELSASLDLEQVLSRTLRVLNELVGAEKIAVTILRPGEKELHLLYGEWRVENGEWSSYAPLSTFPSSKAASFDPQQGLAGWIIQSRQPVLIADLLEDPRWRSEGSELPPESSVQPTETSSGQRSAIGVPLLVGAEALGVLFFFHPLVNHFSIDQLDLIQAAANQVAVAVNNAELYRLIRDQAEDLGRSARIQQIEASRSRAILEAVADGVLVTDASRTVTLFNASAENILGLNRASVIGQSLESFTGLFGRAAQDWMRTIQSWSKDPASRSSAQPHSIAEPSPAYQPGDEYVYLRSRVEPYAEQITLEDGRWSLFTSPSAQAGRAGIRKGNALRGLLGTVSVFGHYPPGRAGPPEVGLSTVSRLRR